VGIVDVSSQAVALTFTLYLQILGLISVSLAILNLLRCCRSTAATSCSRSSRACAPVSRREVYTRVRDRIALFLVLTFIGLSNTSTTSAAVSLRHIPVTVSDTSLGVVPLRIPLQERDC